MFKNYEKRFDNEGYCEKINNNKYTEDMSNTIDEFIVKAWKKTKDNNLNDISSGVYYNVYNELVVKGKNGDMSVCEMKSVMTKIKNACGIYSNEFDKEVFDFVFIMITEYSTIEIQNCFEDLYRPIVKMVEADNENGF